MDLDLFGFQTKKQNKFDKKKYLIWENSFYNKNLFELQNKIHNYFLMSIPL